MKERRGAKKILKNPKRITFDVERADYEMLLAAAQHHKMSLSALLRAIVRGYIAGELLQEVKDERD